MTDIIRAGALWGYCQLARFLGHDPDPLLDHVGLSEVDLDNMDNFLPRPAVIALLEHSAARLDCPDLGLRLASVQDVHILGALAFAIRNAPDVRGALAAASNYVHYHSPSVGLDIAPSDKPHEVRITFSYAHQQSAADNPQMTEQSSGLFCRVYRHLTGGRLRLSRVTFAHARISPPDVYEEYLALIPEFDACLDSICVNRHQLDIPLSSANSQLQPIIERYLELNAPKPGPDTGRRVRQALAQLMSNGSASIEDVSEMLNTHPRTLQRRLVTEGTTFERVRDDVRKHLAEAHLANEVVSLADVAFLLGYANQSVLTRSCQRWFGKTPLAMRREASRGYHAA